MKTGFQVTSRGNVKEEVLGAYSFTLQFIQGSRVTYWDASRDIFFAML